MHCQYCGFLTGEDEHRCQRCGRRITGTVIPAPLSYGATALAAQPEEKAEAAVAGQPALFAEAVPAEALQQKVIPFDQIQRQAAVRGFVSSTPAAATAPAASALPAASTLPGASTLPAARKAAPRAAAKKSADAGQANFDFRPNGAQAERILATGVPAQVYGEGRVAPPMRRVTAGAMDVSMVLLGFGLFAITARYGGSAFGTGRAFWITLSLAMALISLFYGLLWAIASRETAGMNWTQLHLVTFDGSALDGRNRAIRFVSAWLSYCSGGLGLLWALADEENLAFHDHISKTYPAERPAGRAFVRQRD